MKEQHIPTDREIDLSLQLLIPDGPMTDAEVAARIREIENEREHPSTPKERPHDEYNG